MKALPARTLWYHLSDTWSANKLTVNPRSGRVDDKNDPRDTRPFIAVCPTIAQCVIALGAWYDYERVKVYVAESAEPPVAADWVFDHLITHEHRFYVPTKFVHTSQVINLHLMQKKVKPLILDGLTDAQILTNARLTLGNLAFLKRG